MQIAYMRAGIVRFGACFGELAPVKEALLVKERPGYNILDVPLEQSWASLLIPNDVYLYIYIYIRHV